VFDAVNYFDSERQSQSKCFCICELCLTQFDFILAAGETSEKLSDGGDLRGAAGGDWSAIPAEGETERTATIAGTAQLNKS
jgi:hypothetical protein